MELFKEDGCFTREGLLALTDGQLDEMGRLEAAEHLSYCDKCMDRYTALLTEEALQDPPHSARGAVMTTIWVRLMQNTYGRAAVATVAAVLALTMWRSGGFSALMLHQNRIGMPSTSQSQTAEPERLGSPVQDDDRTPVQTGTLGKPVEDTPPGAEKPTLADALNGLLFGKSGADRNPGHAADHQKS